MRNITNQAAHLFYVLTLAACLGGDSFGIYWAESCSTSVARRARWA